VTQSPQPFNPNLHLMQIKNRNGSQDYLPVQWRLVWFRELCPDGTIETEMLHLDLDRETEEETYAWNNETRRSEKVTKRAQGIAVFRATVKDGKGGCATGTKSEKAASFPDYIEKAETGAIGRALAALGYGTQFAPEMDERERIVDAPVYPPAAAKPAQQKSQAVPTATTTKEQAEPAIARMIEMARSRCERLGADWEEIKAEAIGRNIADRELILTSFKDINALITRKEHPARLSA
jgi:hypothetical protein